MKGKALFFLCFSILFLLEYSGYADCNSPLSGFCCGTREPEPTCRDGKTAEYQGENLKRCGKRNSYYKSLTGIGQKKEPELHLYYCSQERGVTLESKPESKVLISEVAEIIKTKDTAEREIKLTRKNSCKEFFGFSNKSTNTTPKSSAVRQEAREYDALYDTLEGLGKEKPSKKAFEKAVLNLCRIYFDAVENKVIKPYHELPNLNRDTCNYKDIKKFMDEQFSTEQKQAEKRMSNATDRIENSKDGATDKTDHIKRYLKDQNDSKPRDFKGLSDSEKVSIYMYTLGFFTVVNPLFTVKDKHLLNENEFKENRAYLDMFGYALKKLPTSTTTVYRVDNGHLFPHKEGSNFLWTGPFSTTRLKPGKETQDASASHLNRNVKYASIIQITGKDITDFSAHREEKEILGFPQGVYRVNSFGPHKIDEQDKEGWNLSTVRQNFKEIDKITVGSPLTPQGMYSNK